MTLTLVTLDLTNPIREFVVGLDYEWSQSLMTGSRVEYPCGAFPEEDCVNQIERTVIGSPKMRA